MQVAEMDCFVKILFSTRWEIGKGLRTIAYRTLIIPTSPQPTPLSS